MLKRSYIKMQYKNEVVMKSTQLNSAKYYTILHITLFINSFGAVCSKMASTQPFLSLRFCLCYGGMIAILGVYAIAWQQIIKHMPLTTAFCNKAVSIVWGILWGVLIFKEAIKWNMILGAVIVIVGVIIVVTADE
ncbi:EamA family transporter [Eubacterium sp.]|uniref:EamA family transporter n=1 Tax=Eubacterium sp. TaxID=142586 RepID=UPI003F739E8D